MQEQRKHLRLAIGLTSLFNHKVISLYQHQDADNSFSHFSYVYSIYKTRVGLKEIYQEQTYTQETHFNTEFSAEEIYAELLSCLSKKQQKDPYIEEQIKEIVQNIKNPHGFSFVGDHPPLTYLNPICLTKNKPS